MNLKMTPLSSLKEALTLASIRNQCRHLLTNDQQEISQLQQIHWFEHIYTQQNPQYYWVWLLKESNENIIGYFAAKEAKEGIYITEGILEDKRGAGAGTFMLNFMLCREVLRKKPIYADIFEYNYASLRLHKKFGFTEHSRINEQITRFCFMDASC